jgi:cold shock CspA family protein
VIREIGPIQKPGLDLLEKDEVKTKRPRMWNIVFYNDDYTPLDFVEFVRDRGGKDVFVHISALAPSGVTALNEGDRVIVVSSGGEKGWKPHGYGWSRSGKPDRAPCRAGFPSSRFDFNP